MAFQKDADWFARKYKGIESAIAGTKELIDKIRTLPVTEEFSEGLKVRQIEANESYLKSLEKDWKRHDTEYSNWRNKRQNLERGCPPYKGY